MAEKIYYELIPDAIPPELYERVKKFVKHGCETGYLKRYKPPKRGEKSQEDTSPLQRRIGAIFGRRASTTWSKKEMEAWKAIGGVEEVDVACIERYYKTMKKKPKEEDISRRDLQTLLNNWHGELDRARSYKYSVYQNSEEGVLVKEPDNWKRAFEEISGNKPNSEWRQLAPDTMSEIISFLKNNKL
jgi:hypothetical protein